MPKLFPEEFRRDVVAIARKCEAPLNQIAKDFGISEPTLHSWLKRDDVEDGNRLGIAKDEYELRSEEVNSPGRAGGRSVASSGRLPVSGLQPKMVYRWSATSP